MSLPDGTRNFTIEVKYYLSCYRALDDASRAVLDLQAEQVTFGTWRIRWAGICSILKSSIHLMKIDAKRCFSDELRAALRHRYAYLGNNKSEFPIFWQFTDRERHNVLKEYEFSAYEEIIHDPDNAEADLATVFKNLLANRELRIRGGLYDGRRALDVAAEACAWQREYLDETIRMGGFEPEERLQSHDFLHWRRADRATTNSLVGDILNPKSDEEAPD